MFGHTISCPYYGGIWQTNARLRSNDHPHVQGCSYRRIRRTLRQGLRLWQRNCYEHVIRDEAEWDRVRRYIESSPLNWAKDEENLEMY